MIKILVCSPIKADATSYYRAWGPLQHMANRFDDIKLIDISISDLELSWAVLMQGDIIFMQRPSTDVEVRIMRIAKNCNVPVWIDYDDDYLNIPKTNPRHELYADPHRVEQIKRAIEYADMITVSTIPLKEGIIKATGKDKNKIQVIPNGVDETLFDTSKPLIEEISGRDIVLWRGGDTHAADIDPYLEKMVLLYNEFPKYKWAFVGNPPEKFLKMVDNSRIMLYAWEDVFVYFDRLMELRPKVTIVPWAKTVFNDSKSNCSWIESTLAGAATIFPKWSSEFVPGMEGYHDPEEFYIVTRDHLKGEFSASFVMESFMTLNRFTLYALNSMRYTITKNLHEKKNLNRFGFRNEKYKEIAEPVSDEGFFKYTHENNYIQENTVYRDSHYKVAQELLDRLQPSSVIEIGCGPGPMVEYFLDKKIPQVAAFEINPFFREYFVKRNPHYGANFITANILNCLLPDDHEDQMKLEGVFDLGISIEVFEHIEADKVDALIEKLSRHFKHFYFSSTPYHTSKSFDAFWGHKNLRTHEQWIKSFEQHGWIYQGNPQLIVGWDHLFKSIYCNEDVKVFEVK
jgi:SAM-dependent methyltransferase